MTIADLMMQYECASECLVLLEQCGATDAVVTAQRDRCRELRAMINRECPDSPTYDPRADNIVERI